VRQLLVLKHASSPRQPVPRGCASNYRELQLRPRRRAAAPPFEVAQRLALTARHGPATLPPAYLPVRARPSLDKRLVLSLDMCHVTRRGSWWWRGITDIEGLSVSHLPDLIDNMLSTLSRTALRGNRSFAS